MTLIIFETLYTVMTYDFLTDGATHTSYTRSILFTYVIRISECHISYAVHSFDQKVFTEYNIVERLK